MIALRDRLSTVLLVFMHISCLTTHTLIFLIFSLYDSSYFCGYLKTDKSLSGAHVQDNTDGMPLRNRCQVYHEKHIPNTLTHLKHLTHQTRNLPTPEGLAFKALFSCTERGQFARSVNACTACPLVKCPGIYSSAQ